MAASRGGAVAVLLLLALVLVEAADDDTTHLHFFMHDVVSGTNPTSVQVIKGPGSSSSSSSGGMSFGDTRVVDAPLTSTSASTSPEQGRMQGVLLLASQSGAARMVTANILLTSGDNNGSTLAVMGRDDTADAGVRELSVIGGTGKFRMASGYVQWKTAAANGPDSTFELDVYFGNNGTATAGDGSAPGSDDGSGSSGGSKSSSGATTSMTTVSAAGWAVAAAAAVVGSVWVW